MTHDLNPTDHRPRDGRPRGMSRRAMVWLTSRAAFLGGLAGGYGLFAWIGGRFLLPSQAGRLHQLVVARESELNPGDTLLYQTPDNRPVNITRRGVTGAATDFIALSSTCPHLGCQVRWEGQHNRYFCPCHNGTFDAEGKATGGPPHDAGQSLPRYALTVERGLLYIHVPAEQLSIAPQAATHPAESPRVDPSCLTCSERRRAGATSRRRA